jgi:hypothetical protein
VQSYSNGHIVRWIEPALEGEHPSPRINVTARGGVIEDLAGEEAGPEADRGAAAAASPQPAAPAIAAHGGTGASEGLAIAALIVGALGLAAALGAFATVRRRT